MAGCPYAPSHRRACRAAPLSSAHAIAFAAAQQQPPAKAPPLLFCSDGRMHEDDDEPRPHLALSPLSFLAPPARRSCPRRRRPWPAALGRHLSLTQCRPLSRWVSHGRLARDVVTWQLQVRAEMAASGGRNHRLGQGGGDSPVNNLALLLCCPPPPPCVPSPPLPGQAPLGTRRVCFLSGMYAAEVMETIVAFKEAGGGASGGVHDCCARPVGGSGLRPTSRTDPTTHHCLHLPAASGLPEAVFAAAVPNNYDRRLGELVAGGRCCTPPRPRLRCCAAACTA